MLFCSYLLLLRNVVCEIDFVLKKILYIEVIKIIIRERVVISYVIW